MMNHYYYQNPMQPYVPQQPDPVQQQQQDMNMLMQAAKTGAIVGGTGAAAMNLHQMRNNGLPWQEAAANTAKVALTAGIATAAATAVGRLFARNSALSLAATLATGTAVMYVLTDRQQAAATEDDNDE